MDNKASTQPAFADSVATMFDATTQTAFLGIDAKTHIKVATLQTFTDSIEATFIRSMRRQSSLKKYSTVVFMPRVSHRDDSRDTQLELCVVTKWSENLKLFKK